MDRKEARLYLAAMPAVASALRASSSQTGLSWPALLALHLLTLTDGLSVEQLAAALGRSSSTMSPELKKLRASGLLRETSCTEHPERCPAPASRRPCGDHHLQWLTELGREAAETWAEPYLRLLTTTHPRLWLRLAHRLRTVQHSVVVPGAQRLSRRGRRAA